MTELILWSLLWIYLTGFVVCGCINFYLFYRDKNQYYEEWNGPIIIVIVVTILWPAQLYFAYRKSNFNDKG